MTNEQFFERHDQIAADCEEPGLSVDEVIARLRALADDLERDGIDN
jgi:hypothetical protein